jgi:rod shape-determining protein MreC
MRNTARSRTSITSIPLRVLAYRTAIALMLFASIALLIASKTNNDFIRSIRGGLTDGLVPVVQTLAAPINSIDRALAWMHDMTTLREENQKLREQNTTLMRWQFAATELENENARLRDLLKFAPSGKESYTSARVAIDSSGPYVKAVVINAGKQNNVEADLAVVNENGLVGRVVETSERSSRVLLLTDINSRVPVMTETSRERAIATGDNSDNLVLKYAPQDSKIKVGERLLTTSDGGVMPPGLPVGVVSQIKDGIITVKPYVDWYRLEYVSVVDFSM